MKSLFEESDLINNPIECFMFDSKKNEFPVRLHYHYYMEMIFMLKGTAKVTSGNNEYLAKRGEIVIFHPNAVHSVDTDDEDGILFIGIKLDINRMNLAPSYSPKYRSIFKSIEMHGLPCLIPADSVGRMGGDACFGKCLREVTERKYGYDQILKSELYVLLTDIIRYYQSIGFNIDNEMFALDGRYDIFSITDYIDSNIGKNIKVADIAEMCGMSYSYFAKQFTSVYGKSCKEYIDEMRAYKAEELVVFTNFDLSYIADECGFSDCSHLINSFKKYKGSTPKQYRMRYGKK